MRRAYGDAAHEEVDRDAAVDGAQPGREREVGRPGDTGVGDE